MNHLVSYVFFGAAALLLAGIIYTAIKPGKWKFRALNIGATATMAAFFWCHFSGLFQKWDIEEVKMIILIAMALFSIALVIVKSCKVDPNGFPLRREAVRIVAGIGSCVFSYFLMFPFMSPNMIHSLSIGVIVTALAYDAVDGFSPGYIVAGPCVLLFLVIMDFLSAAVNPGEGSHIIIRSLFAGNVFHILWIIPLVPMVTILQIIILLVPHGIREHRMNRLDTQP